MTRIGVVGCGGRMGQMITAAIIGSQSSTLAGGTESSGHPAIGRDPAHLVGGEGSGTQIFDDPAILFEHSDVIVDFTVPAVTARHVAFAKKTKTPLVIGTTGMSEEQQEAIEKAAESVAILQAANMSLGVNIMLGVTRKLAALLDEAYDIEILEMHHRHKVDAPSGTALALGREAARGRNVALSETGVFAREGQTGARPEGAIGFATLRGGDVAGEHTVMFAGPDERLELTHKASSRTVFARGAVHAAEWIVGRPPGLYAMADVLGLAED